MSSQRLDTKTNFVCIENKFIQQGDFKLISNKKGKLYKGPVYNAYNRENLGSIPGKIENVLFKDKIYANKLGFNSQTSRFENNDILITELDSNSNKITSIDKKEKSENNIKNLLSHNTSNSPSYSLKGYGNGFISGSERFLTSYNIYENKYFPGPGEHNIKSQTINETISNSQRYSKLYKNTFHSGKYKEVDFPGPGDYNIRTDLLNNKGQSGNFASPVKDSIKKSLLDKKINKNLNHISNSPQNTNTHLNTMIPNTQSSAFLNTNDKSLLEKDKSLNSSININKSFSTADQSIIVKKYSNFRGKTKNIFEIDSLYANYLEKSKEKKKMKNYINQKHQLENLVESYVDRKNNKFFLIKNNNENYENKLGKRVNEYKNQESNTNLNLPTEFINHFHKRSDSQDKSVGVDIQSKNPLPQFNESLQIAPNREFIISNISNVNLRLETENERVRKRLEKMKIEEELIKKIQQIKSHPSHFFTSSSNKIEFASKKSHIPGPSYYNPQVIPSHLSFNVNNKLFTNNQFEQEQSHKSVWL